MSTNQVATRPYLLSPQLRIVGQPSVASLQQALVLKYGAASIPQETTAFASAFDASRAESSKVLSSLSSSPELKDAAVLAYLSHVATLCPALSYSSLNPAAANPAAVPAATDAATATASAAASDVDAVMLEGADAHTTPPAPGGVAAAAGTSEKAVQLPAILTIAWKDTLAGAGTSQATDLSVDVAQCLLTSALWDMSKAASLCSQAEGGAVDSEPALQAFKLLRFASGTLQLIRLSLLPLVRQAKSSAWDLQPELISALEVLCLAEAQGLSLLRAIAKGHQPSLIAGIAAESAALVASAFQHVSSLASRMPGSGGPAKKAAQADNTSQAYADITTENIATWTGFVRKLGAFLKYKFAVYQIYTYSFAAMDYLKADKAGAAVKLTQEAGNYLDKFQKLVSDYDSALPKTTEKEHKKFDEDVRSQAAQIAARCKKDNDYVYYQSVPSAVPALPEHKRLAEPLLPSWPPTFAPTYTAAVATQLKALSAGAPADKQADHHGPQPSAQADGNGAHVAVPAGQADSTHPADVPVQQQHVPGQAPPQPASGGFSCCRCLVYALIMPILLMISLIGILIWILLLPLKCCCCPVGCLVQCIANVVEWLVKAPLNGLLWVTGSPWQPTARVPAAAAAPAATDVEHGVKK